MGKRLFFDEYFIFRISENSFEVVSSLGVVFLLLFSYFYTVMNMSLHTIYAYKPWVL